MMKIRWPLTVVFVLALYSNVGALTLFEDDFNSGAMSPEWVSKNASQWVEDGWLYCRDMNPSAPRDASAIVHDGDTTWTDYNLSLTVQLLDTGTHDYANVLFRTDNYIRNSVVHVGSAYELKFIGPGGWASPYYPGVGLFRTDWDLGTSIALAGYYPWPVTTASPMDVVISVTGGRIQVWIDSLPVIDVVDPDPLLYGGIGVHTIWESGARFDNVRVTTSVPDGGSTLALMGVVFAGLAVVRRGLNWA